MNRKKILLVDDATTVLMMEQMILNQPEFQLLSARDGEGALEIALREVPDLILLDVIMPGMTGIEVCQELRRDPRTKDVPIVMVTTRNETDYVKEAREAGCTDYVTKPFNAAALLEKVRDLIGISAREESP